jgi:hypothetical protein
VVSHPVARIELSIELYWALASDIVETLGNPLVSGFSRFLSWSLYQLSRALHVSEEYPVAIMALALLENSAATIAAPEGEKSFGNGSYYWFLGRYRACYVLHRTSEIFR